MQDWSLYLYGSFDLLLNYSIPKVGLGGGTSLKIENTKFRMSKRKYHFL